MIQSPVDRRPYRKRRCKAIWLQGSSAQGGSMRRSVFLLALLFIAVLGAMAAAPLLEQAPRLRDHNAATQFDARRAEARLTFILGEQLAHPADSSGDDGVRSRLTMALRKE